MHTEALDLFRGFVTGNRPAAPEGRFTCYHCGESGFDRWDVRAYYDDGTILCPNCAGGRS
jgi:transcription elongation factor Elf1